MKLVAGPRPVLRSLGGGQLLGATIVGPRAGEMIAEVALPHRRTRAFTWWLAQTIHAYPTWSVAVQHAATGSSLKIPWCGGSTGACAARRRERCGVHRG